MATMLTLLLPIFLAPTLWAQTGQPTYPSSGSGTFQIVGDSGVSAQQLFVGTANKVYIVDKTENNPLRINNHPAWASEYTLNDNSVRAMDVVTNTFCAGGTVMGDGTWINVGGNQKITYGGLTVNKSSEDIYKNGDGGFAVRFLKPCDDESCNWVDDPKNYITTRRWYPTLETLPDGSVIILSGSLWGGYVSGSGNNNPTYEFYPSRGDPVYLSFLDKTVPLNLYPLAYVLPSGRLWLASYQSTEFLDWETNDETPGPNIPYSARTYPANAAVTMLPLTVANNYTATILFCGGTANKNWNVKQTVVAALPADDTCVRISPDTTNKFEDDDKLPQPRNMGNFILLPDGKVFLANGVETGTAGYGNDSWAIGQSYGTDPILQPYIYDPEAPAGSRFSDAGLSPSTIPRLYHSTASLLPDGSIIISGSNPNADVTTYGEWQTEWRTERFFPPYYGERRPEPVGIPQTLTYGGAYFNVTLSATDLGNDPQASLGNTKVALMRFGFSTHAVNFGQKYLQLENSWYLDTSGQATLMVSQVPPNPALFAPGPAWLFVVVNGIPSIAQPVMVGSGKIETQKTIKATPLPVALAAQTTSSAVATQSGSGQQSGAAALSVGGLMTVALMGVAGFVGAFVTLF